MLKKYEINLDMPAISVNAVSCRDVRFKTAEFKDWSYRIQHELSKCAEHVQELNKLFSITSDHFEVSITLTYPVETFYLKNGAISSRTYDVSNFEKPLLDEVFNKFIGVDDKYITKLTSAKKSASVQTQSIAIEILHCRL